MENVKKIFKFKSLKGEKRDLKCSSVGEQVNRMPAYLMEHCRVIKSNELGLYVNIEGKTILKTVRKTLNNVYHVCIGMYIKYKTLHIFNIINILYIITCSI